MLTASDIVYLQNVNIVKLQSAARMSGIRWKSGTLDKAGIISRLQDSPSMGRATIACLQRMGGDNPPAPTPSSFVDDISSEASEARSIEQPIEARTDPLTGKIETQETSDRITADWLKQYALQTGLDRAMREIGTIRAYGEKLSETTGKAFTTVEKALESLKTTVESLRKQTPIQINIPAHEPIVIDPATSHVSYPKLIQYLQINRRVILTGSAGTGKSLAVKNAATAFNLPFYLQTPVTMDHQYLGHRDAQGVFHETPTFKAYTQGGVLLWDEADAGLPDAMLAANPIFDGNGFAVFGDGNLYAQHPDFMSVFNMNTDGNGATMQYAGRNRLDGATLARFGVRIHWEIDPRIESAMASGQPSWHKACLAIRDFMTLRQIVDVNVTPRHVKTGAALLHAGCPRRDVLIDCLKSGALSEVWSDVEYLPAVRSFLQGV